MSMTRQMAVAGQTATAIFEEDSIKNLRTGLSFNAKISPMADTILNSELGIDPRATDLISCRDKTIDIQPGDRLSAQGKLLAVLPRNAPDNPAKIHLEIYCECLTSVDT
jgi:hypothetical protein